jgi:plastocyanin
LGRSLKFAACLASVLWCAGAGAATLEVTVHDREGQPVPDVVITATAPGAPIERRMDAPLGVMDQIDQQFVPEVLVVRVGTSVVFPNSDSVAHQVYSFSPAKRFQLGLYRGRAHPPIVFDQPGLVVLGCNIHDQMVGYVLVTETPHFGKTDARGSLQLSKLPAGSLQVTVWHPRFAADEPPIERTLTLSETQVATETVQLAHALLPPPKKHHDSRVRDY